MVHGLISFLVSALSQDDGQDRVLRPRLALAILGSLLVSSFLISPTRSEDPQAKLRAQVNMLVEQLGAADTAKQDAAAAALLKLGPDILPLLPEDEGKLTPNQVKQLKTIRSTLRNALAQKDLAPRSCTLQDSAMPLSKALAELARQTGNTVADRRKDTGDDPKLRLSLVKATFWQALDAIAKEADVRLSFFDRQGQIALIDGPYQAVPTSYSGIFRTAVKRITVVRDLENAEGNGCAVNLEIAWEPRFQPLFLEAKPDALTAQDDKGLTLNIPEGDSGRIPIRGRMAIDVPIRLEAPKRSVAQIGLLQGTLSMISPSKLLTFTFDKPAKAEAKQEGVTVKIHQFDAQSELWSVGVTLEYPPETPDFESFESWLVNNQIYLQKKGGTRRYPANGGYEIDEQAGHKATLTYRFVEENDLMLGKPEEWKLIYVTPGMIAKLPVKFEFKDLPLP
jgi:hypothetical protein